MDPKEARRVKTVRELQQRPADRRCFHCSGLGTAFVVPQFCIFVCTDCSGAHYQVGHRVKSCSMAKFTQEEVDALQAGGNEVAALRYLARWKSDRDVSRPADRNARNVEAWVRAVLVDKKFFSDVPIPVKEPPIVAQVKALEEPKPPAPEPEPPAPVAAPPPVAESSLLDFNSPMKATAPAPGAAFDPFAPAAPAAGPPPGAFDPFTSLAADYTLAAAPPQQQQQQQLAALAIQPAAAAGFGSQPAQATASSGWDAFGDEPAFTAVPPMPPTPPGQQQQQQQGQQGQQAKHLANFASMPIPQTSSGPAAAMPPPSSSMPYPLPHSASGTEWSAFESAPSDAPATPASAGTAQTAAPLSPPHQQQQPLQQAMPSAVPPPAPAVASSAGAATPGASLPASSAAAPAPHFQQQQQQQQQAMAPAANGVSSARSPRVELPSDLFTEGFAVTPGPASRGMPPMQSSGQYHGAPSPAAGMYGGAGSYGGAAFGTPAPHLHAPPPAGHGHAQGHFALGAPGQPQFQAQPFGHWPQQQPMPGASPAAAIQQYAASNGGAALSPTGFAPAPQLYSGNPSPPQQHSGGGYGTFGGASPGRDPSSEALGPSPGFIEPAANPFGNPSVPGAPASGGFGAASAGLADPNSFRATVSSAGGYSDGSNPFAAPHTITAGGFGGEPTNPFAAAPQPINGGGAGGEPNHFYQPAADPYSSMAAGMKQALPAAPQQPFRSNNPFA